MESLTSSGGTPAVITTGNGTGNNGILEAAIIASMFGGRGFGRGDLDRCERTASEAFAERAADNTAQLLTAVTKSEGDIKESVNATAHRNQIENAGHFGRLNDRLCDAEKESIKAGYEARLEALQTKSDLLANQNANTMSIKDDIRTLHIAQDKSFCELQHRLDKDFCRLDNTLDKKFHHIEHLVDSKFDKLFERELKQENRELRDRLEKVRFNDLNEDINEMRRNINKLVCAVSKVPVPANALSNLMDGCCG